jgi:RecA-family ATPase
MTDDEWRAASLGVPVSVEPYAEDDGLPPVETLDFGNLPPLPPEQIHGLLRQGGKLYVTAQSKAGKTFLLIQLAEAIATGRKWLGWDCEQGRVLYCNFEIDRASFTTV